MTPGIAIYISAILILSFNYLTTIRARSSPNRRTPPSREVSHYHFQHVLFYQHASHRRSNHTEQADVELRLSVILSSDFCPGAVTQPVNKHSATQHTMIHLPITHNFLSNFEFHKIAADWVPRWFSYASPDVLIGDARECRNYWWRCSLANKFILSQLPHFTTNIISCRHYHLFIDWFISLIFAWNAHHHFGLLSIYSGTLGHISWCLMSFSRILSRHANALGYTRALIYAKPAVLSYISLDDQSSRL
jgi:hypothetical protein